MSNNVKSQPLTFSDSRTISDNISGFALEFWNEDSGEMRPLQWIEDEQLVTRFVAALGLQYALADSPITSLQQQAYLKTTNGKILAFRLYKVFPDRPGLITFAGGSAKTSADLHQVITEAYSLAFYNPREESHRLKMKPVSREVERGIVEAARRDVLEQIARCKKDAGSLIDPWVVVVWNDYSHETIGKDWAAWYLNLRPLNTFTMKANGLNSIASVVQSIRRSGNDVKQIIMAVHGTEAEFDLRSPTDPFNSQYCCGLYANQTTGTQYGKALVGNMAAYPTITLLSCDTAGTSGLYAGTILMSQVSTALYSYVIASDQDVYLTNHGNSTIPYTSGNIWRSVPGTPNPVIWSAASPDQNMPLQYY